MTRDQSPGLDAEIQSSYERLRDIKMEELDCTQRIKSIDSQIAKLENERSKCLDKRVNLLGSNLTQAIVPYSQSWTLQFVTKMRSYLPRELRDMVYQQLVNEDMHFMRPWLMLTLASRKQCPERPCQCLRDLSIPHILSPAYVGPEIALEVVEAFYKSYGAEIFIADRVENINNVLLPDHFHVGFNPADVARQLTINWKLSRSVQEENKKGVVKHRRPTRKDFSPLLKIRNKPGFHLRIFLSQRHIRFSPIENALVMIKPICQQLTKEGVKVELAFLYDTSDELEFPLNDVYAQPPKMWRKNLAKALDENDLVMEHHKEYKNEQKSSRGDETSSDDSEEYPDSDEMDIDYGYPGFDPFGYDSEDMYDEDEMDLYDLRLM